MSPANIKDFHEKLQHWYKRHGRTHLPWRNTPDPYRIYISEIMLQQTQVKTVLERYYTPFLARFSTLAALAKAKRADVLKAWEGLGYYNRAVNLHEAAKLCTTTLPNNIQALLALPGIGKNTAHAIAAFAYHQPVPVMEANVKRVLCRIFALTQPSENILWEKAHLLLDEARPFDYNQAMMDIGALICTRRQPLCPQCPANNICKGKHAPELYPAPKAKKQPPIRKKIIVVFEYRRAYFIQPRRGKFLKGLYGFMEYDPGAKMQFMNRAYTLAKKYHIGSVLQSYSHFTLQAEVYKISAKAGGGIGWKSLKEIAALPLSRADSKILKLLG